MAKEAKPVKMSDREIAIRQRLKDDFIHYASRCLKVRPKESMDADGKPLGLVPFELNRAQMYTHQLLEKQKGETGKVRAIVLKGRQQGMCFSPNMRILTSDYRWIKIIDAKIGERIFAVDEFSAGKTVSGRNAERRIRSTTIEAKSILKKQTYKIIMSNGTEIEVTGEHRFLCKQRDDTTTEWREINDCLIGDKIRVFCNAPDRKEPTFEDGWFSGLLDGEGSFSASPAIRIALSQVEGAVLQRARQYLMNNDIRFYELIDKRTNGVKSKLGDKPVHCLRIDRMTDVIKLMTKTRPSRFIDREIFDNKKLPKSCEGFDSWATVLSIEPIGEKIVVDLQTQHKTVICEGLVSHNSTLIGGRLYHLTTHRKGIQTFILTHALDATQNLFKMAQRYYEHTPELVKPSITISNSKELIFGALDSGYKVGTAENKGVGRSSTIQAFHGSEVAFWSNAAEHAAGIMQAVPDAKGTEIILESTANGVGNYFHQMWQKAEAGDSDFIAIFVPWFWQEEYQRKAPTDFNPTEQERELIHQYGLTHGQLIWRRKKIVDLSINGVNGERLFKQEYPNNSTEAFQLTGEDTYIQSDLVMRARKSVAERYGKLVLGVDPARFGDDRTAIVRRQGRQAWGLETYIKKDTMEITGIVHSIYNAEKPDKIFVDVGGLGAGVVDRLNELLPKGIVVAVNAGSTPLNAKSYLNKRAEMWGLLREWLDDNQAVQIPDSDELHADLCNIRYKIDSNSRLVMEQKADMKKRGIRSSDCADSLCLTFAQPATALNDTNTSNKLAGKIMQTNKLILNARGVLYGNHDTF